MRDELEAPFLDEWLHETGVAPPDPQEGARRVASQLPQTRQVGRWLPFQVFRRRTQTPTATDTTEYQPSPILASNGHTPTVIRRTQSMLSPAKAITAGALVFAIGSALFVAQPFNQPSANPGGETEPAEAVEFTATYPWGGQVAAGTQESRPDGLLDQVGWAHRTFATEASDPRIDGEMVYTCNSVRDSPFNEGFVWNCVWRIDTPDGAWQMRPAVSLEFPGLSNGPFGVFTGVFDGEGAYEGLTAVAEITEVAGRGYTMHGLILNTDLPPDAEPYVAE